MKPSVQDPISHTKRTVHIENIPKLEIALLNQRLQITMEMTKPTSAQSPQQPTYGRLTMHKMVLMDMIVSKQILWHLKAMFYLCSPLFGKE